MRDKAHIRSYTSQDKGAVLHLLRLNTPKYFAPEEEKDLVYYLDHELEYYFVIDYKGTIVGCGGINFSGNPAVGKISWDILHPEYQGKGLGTMLLNHRINRLKAFPAVQTIMVRTTQLVYRFYEKAGFKLVEQQKDYWADGFDLYRMEYQKM